MTPQEALQRTNAGDIQCVIADHLHLLPEDTEVLHEVEGKAVVIVDHQEHATPTNYLIQHVQRGHGCLQDTHMAIRLFSECRICAGTF